MENFIDFVKGAVFGLAVGDALGVPVEFVPRDTLKQCPVTDMISGGAHNQPAGTWSDDTSMTLCVLQSLAVKGIDYEDQMKRFEDWLWNASNTADNLVFDVGNTTKFAIFKHAQGTDPLDCGDDSEFSYGNGSIMRIVPVALFLIKHYKDCALNDTTAHIIHNASKLTHAHKRCLMACGIYCSIVFELYNSGANVNSVKKGIEKALEYYKCNRNFSSLYDDFVMLENIEKMSEDDIGSSGYVIDTLFASVLCLLKTDSYEKAVLKAVNLGDDSDTTAAVTGALAGLIYKTEGIPQKWLNTLKNKELINSICDSFLLN